MANQINELSPDIRDFLLNRNLIVSDTVSNNGLSDLAIGLGSQASIDTLANSVLASDDIEESSIDFRNALVSRNQYTSIEDMVQATVINNSFSYNQVDGGYLEENGQLNIGGPSTDALDILTSITSQEGFSLGDGGFIPNNNINTSITGRVLGGVGAINDTPLGIIGGQQLLLAFKQKLLFNTQKELLGKVNLQPFSLLRGADFINPDYSITVSSSTGGRVLDTALDLTGFELPLSKMDAGASIFEDDSLFQSNSITRNNAMIRNTGKGQILRLFENLNQNQSKISDDPVNKTYRYKPAYESDRNDDRLGVVDPSEYANVSDDLVDFSDNIFDDESEEFGNIWQQGVDVDDTDNSLLAKTKRLFNNTNYDDLLFNLQGVKSLENKSKLTTPNSKDGNDGTNKWLSKGSGVLSEDYLFNNDDSNVFCRTWDLTKQYDKLSALQKNTGLTNFPNQFRRNTDKSVLDDNGFVKITPYNLPSSVGNADAKKFMFSIENLAWNDRVTDLPSFEVGPGDPITETKGRIMWFPPYDIKFQETTNVNWDTTEFIGRGEPIYTYNNTVRSGNLSFKIIIDHPEYLNKINSSSSIRTDQILASVAAGCTDYERFFSVSELNQLQQEINSTKPVGNTTVANTIETPTSFSFFFPNDVASISDVYEIFGETYGEIPSEGYNAEEGTLYDNGPNLGLNDFWNEPSNIDTIREFLLKNKGYKIVINSYASTAGNNVDNQRLSDARLEFVRRWLFQNISLGVTIEKAISNGSSNSSSSPNSNPADISAKSERKVTIEFIYDPALDPQIIGQAEVKKEGRIQDRELVGKVKRRFHNESEYFEKLEASSNPTDKFVYDSIKEKIRFFQPAFHSTTPEGFNSRLTFLQQCTRQGPTDDKIRANNLAFGAPPVCILRIGDFYNTKIVIESLNFQFEPLVWDLNPEGVGVQPMIANVAISFKFIGGSSLTGPINKLQNAVSFNYFGNTEVYDPRADTIVPKDGGGFEVMTGSTDLRKFLEEDEYPDDKINNVDLDKDQEASAELENSGEAPEPTVSSKTDLEILKDIAWDVDFIDVITEGVVPNTFAFIWNASTPLSNLTKEYDYFLTIKNENGAPQQVLSGKFGPETSDIGDNISISTWSQGVYGIGEQTFRLTFKGNGVYYNMPQKIDPEIV